MCAAVGGADGRPGRCSWPLRPDPDPEREGEQAGAATDLREPARQPRAQAPRRTGRPAWRGARRYTPAPRRPAPGPPRAPGEPSFVVNTLPARAAPHSLRGGGERLIRDPDNGAARAAAEIGRPVELGGYVQHRFSRTQTDGDLRVIPVRCWSAPRGRPRARRVPDLGAVTVPPCPVPGRARKAINSSVSRFTR